MTALVMRANSDEQAWLERSTLRYSSRATAPTTMELLRLMPLPVASCSGDHQTVLGSAIACNVPTMDPWPTLPTMGGVGRQEARVAQSSARQLYVESAALSSADLQ